jgi:phage terminase large subunit
MGLSAFFEITLTNIKGLNGSLFIFYGIKNNPTKIKSTEGIDIAWVEEAETVSNESWQILIPTIRKNGSEIWMSFNPNQETDPTYRRFITTPPDNAAVVPMSWRDNPWFPEELRKEKDYLARVDMDAYEHVWEGKCRQMSNAQIFKGKYRVESFDPQPEWQGPYFGADWGFAQDPTTLVKMWIGGAKLYVEKELYKIGLDIDFTPTEFDKIPEARLHAIRADSARPETISYMQRHGYGNLVGVDKWPGSVEEGITILRSFEEIVVHPSCIHTAEEMRLYSYKTDKLTGDVLPEIVDKHNHCIDPIRYGLQPIIKTSGNTGFLDYLAGLAAEKAAQKKAEEASKN